MYTAKEFFSTLADFIELLNKISVLIYIFNKSRFFKRLFSCESCPSPRSGLYPVLTYLN